MGVCTCSMFCCTLLYVHSSIAIILMGKRELIALLNLSSWCLAVVEPLFLAVPRGCLQFVIVVFPDHTYLLFLCIHFDFLLSECPVCPDDRVKDESGACVLCTPGRHIKTYSKPRVKRPFSKKTKNYFLKTNNHLMQVKSIIECSKGSILQYFRRSLSIHSS